MRKLSRVLVALVLASTVAIPTIAHAVPAFATPTNVVATNASAASAAVSAAKINLTWTAVVGAISYIATVSPAVAGVSQVAIAGQATASYVFEGLTGGTSYSFTVIAKNDVGQDSPASSTATFVAQSIPGDATAVSAIAADGQVTLTWTAPTNLGGLTLGDYKITGDGGYTGTTAVNTLTSKVITGLTSGTSYTFTIKANNSLGDSAGVSYASALVPTVPGAPTEVTASISGSTVTASWTAPTNTGGTGFAISGYTAYLINNSGADVTSSTVTGLNTTFTSVAAGTYTVKVLASNIVGNGARSTASGSVDKPEDAKTAQTITFAAITTKTMPGPLALTATATSNLTVAFSASGTCTVSGTTLTFTGAGLCTVVASQAGDDTYAIAPTVSQPFTINAAAATGPTDAEIAAAAATAAAAKTAANKVITDKAAADKVIADKVISDKAAADKVIADKVAADKVIAAKAAADKVVADKAIADKLIADEVAADKAAADKIITDKAAADKVIADKVITDKAAADKAAAAKKSNYFAVTTSTKNLNTFTTSSSNSQTFTSVGRAIKITIPATGSKTALVKSAIKDPSGKIITLPTTKLSKGKAYSSPILSFKKAGIYTMTIYIGSVKKTVKITIKK